MRSNAIVRIVIYSLVILLLLGILGAGLGIGMFSFHFFRNDGDLVTGEASIPVRDVQELEIDWASGSIQIRSADVDAVHFTETGAASEEEQMVYELKDGTLTIQFSKPSFHFGYVSLPNKDLTITIPRDWQCQELNIDAAAASVEATELSAKTVDLDCASGVCRFENCDVTELDIDTASGDVSFTGHLRSLDCSAASADITAVLFSAPDRVDMESLSGTLELTLPADCGFSAELETVSGSFHSDFPATYTDGRYVYQESGTASPARIDLSGVSGDVYIRKAGQ